MDPITVAVAISAGTALASWINSERAARRSSAKLKKAEALLDKIQDPQFDFSKITPEEFKLVGEFKPEVAPYIAEANPTLIKGGSREAQSAKQARMDALQSMRERALTGEDALTQIDRARAQRQAAEQAQSARATTESLMARRGLSPGSAMAYSLMNQGALGAMQNQALAGEQAARDAEMRRLSALKDSENMARGIFGDETNMEQQNASIINAFNQRQAGNLQGWQNARANTLNEAQRTNLGAKQAVSDKTIAQSNQAKIDNVNRWNSLQTQQANWQKAKALGKVGIIDKDIGIDQWKTGNTNSAIKGAGEIFVAGMNSGKKKEDEE